MAGDGAGVFDMTMLTALALLLTPGEGQAATGPSFGCAGALSPVETLICGDAELSAYDRAMAFAWSHKWRPHEPDWASQQAWLKRRNDCGSKRGCVLEAYQAWIGALDFLDSEVASEPLKRAGDKGMNSSELFLHALGGDWYIVSAQALTFYDLPDGQGPTFNSSDLGTQLIHVVGGKATDGVCGVDFTRLPKGRWKLVETGDTCSGMRSTLSGIYGP